MIKAVIFDVGGVLLQTHDPSFRQRWEAKLGLAPGELERIVLNSEWGTKAQRGAVTEAALWQWVGRRFGLDEAGLKRFRSEFWAGDELAADLIAYIRRLRPRYQTGIISNAMDEMRQILSTVYPVADAFDELVISAEEKLLKPEPAIYQLALARLGRKPEEAVFIDDVPANVAGAQAVGMQAIHFRPGLDLPAALAELGVMADGQR